MDRQPDGATQTGNLVRLGKLEFLDFLRLEPFTVRRVLADADARSLLGAALTNSPTVLVHFRHVCPDLKDDLEELVAAAGTPPVPATHEARDALVRRFSLELLREKAPPLYDALPWHDWDVGILARRYRLWRTRVLLAGEGTTVAVAKLPRTAGLLVVEPVARIARYVEAKAELGKVKRLKVVNSAVAGAGIEDDSFDLAVIGLPLCEDHDAALDIVERAARDVLVLCLRPGAPCPGSEWLEGRGYAPARVELATGGATRPAWWRVPPR